MNGNTKIIAISIAVVFLVIGALVLGRGSIGNDRVNVTTGDVTVFFVLQVCPPGEIFNEALEDK